MKDISFEGLNQTELMKAVISGEPTEQLEEKIEENKHVPFTYDPNYISYINRQDSLGNTAQHYALLKRRAPSVIKPLGVDMRIKNDMGLTSKDLILYSRRKEDNGTLSTLYPNATLQQKATNLIKNSYLHC